MPNRRTDSSAPSRVPPAAIGIPARPVGRLGQGDRHALRAQERDEPRADLLALELGVAADHAELDRGVEAGVAGRAGPAAGVLPGLQQPLEERVALTAGGAAQ